MELIKLNDTISINKKQQLYVINYGNNYSCLGFDVVNNKIIALCNVLNIKNICKYKGTKKAYTFYSKLLKIAHETNKTFDIELYKPFIGNEGSRVEIVYNWGDVERGIIGKSTGFMPCHILLKRCDSIGGGSILKDSIKSFRFI